MTTVVLRIADAAAGGYRVTLADYATGAELIAGDLSGPEVRDGEWSPQGIRDFFAGPEASQPTPKLEAIGRQLAAWLLPGPVKARLDTLRPGGLRVLLDLQAAGLADLPWELLRIGPVPSFLDVQAPFSRVRPGPALAKAEWPLRVLVAVGAAVDDDIGAESEVAAIERELHPYGHSIDLEVLRRPSRTALFERLGALRPHVLLFIGHCDSDPIEAQAAVLRFQLPPPEVPWSWTPSDVAMDLNHLGWTPCVVILNACHTQEPAASFRIADAFMDSGTAACIAMQGDVRGDLAGVLSAAVLRGVSTGKPLDAVVADARGEVGRRTHLRQRDWAFPVLTLAVEPERLLPQRPPSAARDGLAIDFRDICWFVDRREERRKIRDRLRASHADGLPQGLLVLTGPPRSGKSHLARRALEQLAIVFDYRVRYVAAAGAGDEDFLSLLRRIRGPVDGPDALPAQALHPLHWKLNALLAGAVPGPWDGAPASDDRPGYDPAVASGEHAVRDLCTAFAEALGKAAADRPLAFVLDQMSYGDRTLEPSVIRDALLPHLLRPLREGSMPGVLGLLVLEDSECAKYGIDRLVPAQEWIRVLPDLPEPPERLAQEYFWFPSPEVLGSGLGDGIRSVRAAMRLQGDVTPVRFIEKLKSMAVLLYDSEEALRALLGVGQTR